ncbi:MAG: M15 family metallopeptidase [Clostridia bacterium]|nr:M15 family metallopeptidase [Clostridia bacterium]
MYRTDENGEKYREIVPEDYGKKWYSRVIVRREIRVSKDYKPDIVPILDGYGYGCSLNRVAAKPYENMFHAAEKDGYYLVPYSAYRSYDTQYGNFVNRIAQWQSQGFGRAQAIENTVEVIMAPGGSEHNLGLAVDIICTEYDFDTTAEYAWLSANAWRYGFIERYPRDSHDITGVVREPWHWRYVGLEAAKEMHGTGLTFEEYLTKKGITY